MRAIIVIAALAVLALPAAAQVQCCYSWEDGGTILGSYGNVTNIENVSGPQTGLQGSAGAVSVPGAYHGNYYLHVAEDPHSGTPQIYLAWITGLVDGDVVTASFYAYDNTDVASPSMRIWAHYTPVGGDVNSYGGSASGPSEYSSAIDGWDQVTDVPYSWTYAGGTGVNDGLVIEGRLYSVGTAPDDHTDFFIDYICIEAPTTACIHFPMPVNPVEDSSWSIIKALYR